LPVEGGALAGTKIRNWFGDQHQASTSITLLCTCLIEIIIYLWAKVIDDIGNFISKSNPHGFHFVKGPLLTGYQRHYQGPQRSKKIELRQYII
jgi:hypothetical protein